MSTTRALLYASVLLGALFGAFPAQAVDCSAPNLVEQFFPTAGPEQTRWRLCWFVENKHALRIRRAEFRKSPNASWLRVLNDGRLAEMFVPYHAGLPRTYEVTGFNYSWVKLKAADCSGGTLLGAGPDVCKVVRDRGILWKNDATVRRGQELTLWSVLDAGPSNYIVEWSFRDDGSIVTRVGATGVDHPLYPWNTHTHVATWRLDFDLEEAEGDSAYLVTHEPFQQNYQIASDKVGLVSKESFLDWQQRQFNTLMIFDDTLKNNHPDDPQELNRTAYVLVPASQGSSESGETYAYYEFAVTRYHSGQYSPSELPTYVNHEDTAKSDLVVWYTDTLHHIPRYEDGPGALSGVSPVQWLELALQPRALFDTTPLFP